MFKSLSNFTRELNKNPAISDEDESVAKMGFSLDGFVDVARCRVDASRFRDKNNSKNNFFIYKVLFYNLTIIDLLSFYQFLLSCHFLLKNH